VYAPTLPKAGDYDIGETSRFYSKLIEVIRLLPARVSRSYIILGDLNARVGHCNGNQDLVHFLGDELDSSELNLNGEAIIQFCLQSNSSIINTIIKTAGSRTATWKKYPEKSITLDHIITASELKPKVVTCGVRQDFNDCESGHKLTSVQINICGRSHLAKEGKTKKGKTKLDLDSLRRSEDDRDDSTNI
jgi:hypothetical protein